MSAASTATALANSLAFAPGHAVRLPGVPQGGGVPGQQPCGVELGGHVGQRELDPLEAGDGPAERDPRPGVLDRQVQRRLGDPAGLGGDRDPAAVEGRQRELQAFAGGAEQRVRRQLEPVEAELDGRGRVQSHLGDLAPDLEARPALGSGRR